MSKQINYYELDKLDASTFKVLLENSIERIEKAVDCSPSLDSLANTLFSDESVSKLLMLLARLPVFSTDFEELLKDNLDVLNILKKLKFFVNLKIRETIYLLVKLAVASVDQDEAAKIDLKEYFSVNPNSPCVEKIVDLKFKNAIKENVLFNEKNAEKRNEYLKEFERLEKIDPHAVYPTSIYRQSDGCTVATEDSQKIEAVMSTTLTTSIRISSHVLAYKNNLLAEIYRPLGRAVVVLDDKLCDLEYTAGEVEVSTNRRAVLGMEFKEGVEFTKLTIKQQLDRYFEHHGVETKILIKSGNEVDKDLENVQEILIDLKKIGVMRNEPVLVVGGGVIADIAGFACALFHRNTPYVMLATSIVSGIDAGPSPRTCCDGKGYKNAFGAIHPPVVTLTDRTLWRTMHSGMIRHGIAEIVKMAVVENKGLFELLEKIGPGFLVKTKFGTDMSSIKDIDSLDLDEIDADCGRVVGMAMESYVRAEYGTDMSSIKDIDSLDLDEIDADCGRVVGMAMESYVRAEYGNLWETHQCRPHAYGHTWSPGYELPAGMLHGHAVATCMGFGAYLSWKHCNWISETQCNRICKLINDLELSLWHDVMSDKSIFHASTKKMIQKRGGNLAAPLPRGEIGECGYLNDITDDQLSKYVDEYKSFVMSGNFARNGYGIEPNLIDVGLDETATEATAHVRAEIAYEDKEQNEEQKISSQEYYKEEKKEEESVRPERNVSYQEWIKRSQTDRNSEWKMNVDFDKAPDTAEAPHFPHNTLFHDQAEKYAISQTTVVSKNIQVAAKVTMEENLFAPCMVGSLESQFLKIFAKTSKAENILDIGTFTGMSAIAFAEGSFSSGEGGKVHTLESDEKTAQAAKKIFDSCEEKVKKSIVLHHTDAIDWMRDCAEKKIFDSCEEKVKKSIVLHHTDAIDWMRDCAENTGETFDIIFIDADKDNYSQYYALAMGDMGLRPLLADGGCILADNTMSALVYDEDDSRRQALHLFNQHVKNDERVEQAMMTVREGISIITRV
eukprot:CAMPEP_0194193798 /NCGR_PEP_ID=MMETSP0154-20130528/75229_1 /TAXON_ID=1049557 /ORGANISM="Thalassiothrix antarctica, Strain L6-D1" /LENGTH=1011 /DNA_ID=CAMNT_0038918169 /DNA_START=102 /DNA_END=3137 /DNA_ORIENTATION=+